MTKKEYIAYKMRKMKDEDRSQEQKLAIAYSLAKENGKK